MINFTGCKALNTNIDTIEIESNDGLWDLHNASEFIEFIYNNLERILILVWDYYDYDSGKVSKKLQIKLSNIIMFKLTPRDPTMPFEEDKCLEKIIYYDENNQIIFEFRGGITIEVICADLTFKVFNK